MALLCGGGYAEYVAVPEELLLPVPLGLTLCQAAAVPEAWLTAYQLLHLVGNGYATMLTHPLGRRERLEQPAGDLWGHTRARPRTRTLRHARAHTDTQTQPPPCTRTRTGECNYTPCTHTHPQTMHMHAHTHTQSMYTRTHHAHARAHANAHTPHHAHTAHARTMHMHTHVNACPRHAQIAELNKSI